MLKLLLRLKNAVGVFAKEKILTLIVLVLGFVALGAGLVYLFEKAGHSRAFNDYFDAIWWAVVTVTTVGYGDKIPQEPFGKIVAGILMFFGFILMSIFSGTIASIFVNKRLREGSGLENITDKKHLIVCGWNRNAERLLEELQPASARSKESVVLVNELTADDFQSLHAKYPDLRLRFVRGDFVNEKILKKANIEAARAAVILADEKGLTGRENADERTVLAAFTAKSLNRGLRVSAELLNGENEQHLRRAGVDNILVYGEFNGYLFAAGTAQTGITRAAKELMSGAGGAAFTQCEVPAPFFGKSFKELSDHFLKSGRGVLVGFLSQETKMRVDDILSADTSAIDAFIIRKFKEADIDLAEEKKEEMKIRLNPGSDYVIQDTDVAFVIGNR
ncbi:MAG: potassium channel protein [Spirochaetales bacterium]|nr:potassium channel protein [Spirochaetales bacterium]